MNNPDYIKLLDIKKEALEAEKRIREHIRETHVEYSPFLSQSGNCNNRELQRSSDEQITIADLTGVAVQDIQISKAVYEVLSQDE